MIPISEEFPIGKLIEKYKSKTDVHDVFGVILYTEASPHVIKALRDADFWKALNTTSGPRWPIFSIRPAQGCNTTTWPKSHSNAMQAMIQIHKWHEPAENKKLINFFNIKDTSDLPLFIIFAKGSDGEVLQAKFKISGDNADECFNSLHKAVAVAAEAIKDVHEENIKNTSEVFSLMEGALQQHVGFCRIKKGLNFATWVQSIGSLFGVVG